MAKKRKHPVVSCEEFLRGTCTRGSKCRYSHGTGEAVEAAGDGIVASRQTSSGLSAREGTASLESDARFAASCPAKHRCAVFPQEHPTAASLPRGRFLTPVRE